MDNSSINFAFFGGEPLAVPVLNKLKAAGLIPSLIVCNPNRPSGRGQKLTPPPVKVWAEKEDVAVFQPTSYKDSIAKNKLTATNWDLFVVVAYNFILPEWLLKIPKHQTINVHPSLLPKLRGASPIRTAILRNTPEDIGITIMLMDKEMDHGEILEQEQVQISETDWPLRGDKLDELLANKGGKLLAEVIPEWLTGNLLPQEQDHSAASYCNRLQKSDHELNINPHQLPIGKAAAQSWLTINAFVGIGDTFFIYKNKRVKIKRAELTDGVSLRLLRVIPEGKKEVNFQNYLDSL